MMSTLAVSHDEICRFLKVTPLISFLLEFEPVILCDGP